MTTDATDPTDAEPAADGGDPSPVVVFDVNETLLDLAPVRAVVDELLGPEGGAAVWFQRLLQLAMLTEVTGRHHDFTALAESAFHAVGRRGDRTVERGSWSRVADAFGELRAFPDVAPGLERLRADGWTVVALTNSAADRAPAQLAGAGIDGLFDHVVSVDVVETFKPYPAPYLHVAELVGRPAGSLWMVAAHDWDLAGARAAGLRTAFVRRPGATYADVLTPADVEVDDVEALAVRFART